MRRRQFITLLGSAAAMWPLPARAQRPSMPVVGFLRSVSLLDAAALVTAFRHGLQEIGYIEGQNVAIDLRSAEGQLDRLPALVADLIRRPVAVLVCNNNAALAAKAATTTIPIIFATGNDPVRDSLVASLNRPGGNVTGVVFFTSVLGAKRLDLLRQIVPKATLFAILVNPGSPDTEAEQRDVQAAAQAIGQQLIILQASSDRDIETAFTTFVQRVAGALIVGTGAFMFSNRERLVALAARHSLPAIYADREDVAAGGLISYGPSIVDAYRQVGVYAGRILKGEKPADLPVIRSTKFEFAINLKTANALGIAIPPAVLAIADVVIE
ncbi:MAG TPA: ABC transporter substrate-binding protein [Xanthobacteraceae bacterium]|jgi:putative ABC transport system substrate-binding protein